MKPFMLPSNTHIGAWFMPEDMIDDIWEYWNNPPKDIQPKQPGLAFIRENGVERYDIDSNTKDSIDIYVDHEMREKGIWPRYMEHLQACLENYMLTYPEANWTEKFSIKGRFNLQWYPKGGGFKRWHFENTGGEYEVHRNLVFQTYCNDVPDGGTQFKYQNITVPAMKGLTLIFPAGFTHTHKSQVSLTQEKMIVTGWYNFDKIYDAFSHNYVNYIIKNDATN
jgi:hypothetical protein|tara:strand:- start:1706 stop:2374 length:669 start_codon:yes stop_codon:yes gene_type:complete